MALLLCLLCHGLAARKGTGHPMVSALNADLLTLAVRVSLQGSFLMGTLNILGLLPAVQKVG